MSVRNGTYDKQMGRWYHIARDESWKDEAACAGEDPELFYPDVHDQRRFYNRQVCAALQICMECPVVDECLSYALSTDTNHGIWGGMTEMERAKLKGRKRVY